MTITADQYDRLKKVLDRRSPQQSSDDIATDILLAIGAIERSKEDNTFVSIAVPEEYQPLDSVFFRPTGFEDPAVAWECYIPPTRLEHFDGHEQPDLPENWQYEASILGPWGTTYWPTLTGAIAHASIVLRQGGIKYNDGRTVI